MGRAIAIEDVEKMLAELRKEPDLKDFKLKRGLKFCKDNNIELGQLNFLLAVIGAERHKNKP